MAITREDIFKAAEEIAAAGETPTLAAIRKRVGGGSYTTTSEAVKEWRAAVAPKAPIQTPAPNMIRGRLDELGSELWAAAFAMANDRLASERQALDATRAELEASRSEAVELADQLASDLDIERQTRDHLTTDLNRFKEQAETQRKDAAFDAAFNLSNLQKKLDASLAAEIAAQSQLREQAARLEEMSNRIIDAGSATVKESLSHEEARQRLSVVDAALATSKAELSTANKHAAASIAEAAAMRQRLSDVESQLAVAQATNVHVKEQVCERSIELACLRKQIDDLAEALKGATSAPR